MCHHFSDIEQILPYFWGRIYIYSGLGAHQHISGEVFIKFSTTYSEEEKRNNNSNKYRDALCVWVRACEFFWNYVEKLCFINLLLANLWIYITSFISGIVFIAHFKSCKTIKCIQHGAFINVNYKKNPAKHSKRHKNRITTKCLHLYDLKWYFLVFSLLIS